jgi:hypothetical protein
MAEKKVDDDVRRQNLSFFHLMFPVVVLAILSYIPSCGLSFSITMTLIVVKILLVIWQGVSLKSFIESIYN